MRPSTRAALALLLLAPPARAARIVAFDAGHGGKDRGAVVRGVEENELVLAIAKKAAKALERLAGHSPYLTRWEDAFVPLSERVERAEQVGAQALVSLHADKVYGRRGKGVIVWVYGPNKRLPKGPPREPGERMRPAPPRELVSESRILAEQVQRSLRRRGVKTVSYADRGGFAVLKSDKMPSILVELGNLRDPGEWKQLQDPDHQDALAESLAQGVAAFLAGRTPAEERSATAR